MPRHVVDFYTIKQEPCWLLNELEVPVCESNNNKFQVHAAL